MTCKFMNVIKNYVGVATKGMLLLVFLLIFFVLLSFPVYLGIEYGQLPSITEYWLQYLSIFLSSFSFAAVLITIWLQYSESKKQQIQIEKNFEFAQQNYDSQILDKIHFFMSENMEDCRSNCWMLWSKLKTDTSTTNELFVLFQKSITNDWGDEETAKQTFSSELWSNFSGFYKLARYFDVLSNYKYTELTANAIHYYYIFYRPFFENMINIYNRAYDSIAKEDMITQSKEGWVYLIEKYDSIMEEYKLSLC